MPTGDTNDILNNFTTGKQPTENDWKELIKNSLNVIETSPQTLVSPLSLTSGSHGTNYSSSHYFDEIAPSFVPNLHPNVKVFCLDPHTFLAASSSGAFRNVGTNASLWEFDTDNNSILHGGPSGSLRLGGYNIVTGLPYDISSAPQFKPYQSGSGAFSLVTGPDSGEKTSISATPAIFQCSSGQQWWAKTRFDIDLHDNMEFFFGVMEHSPDSATTFDQAAAAGKDRVGFSKGVHTNDEIKYQVTKNTVGSIINPFAPAINYSSDRLRISLGIWWDGSRVNFYHNTTTNFTSPVGQMEKIKDYSFSAAIPDDSNMKLCFILQTGTSGRKTATIEYLCGAVLNNRLG